MNFYSNSLDYNFLNKNFNFQNNLNNKTKSKPKDELDKSMNKIIYDEIKNGFKKKFPKDSGR